jgi:drug/metabolite transporter (DMT)-like permease
VKSFAILWTGASPSTRGIALIVLSTFGFAGMHTLIRYVSAEIHPFEIAFFRNLFGMVVFAPWLIRHGFAILRTRRIAMHGLRAALNIVAMLAFFTGLSMTPIARVTALGFTAPVFAALLAVLFLGERFRFRRWAAMICGFGGTLIILRPGFEEIDVGSLLILLSTFAWGITLIVIKMLGRTDSSLTITAYMNITLGLLSFIPALFVWTTPSAVNLFWMLCIGVLGTFAQLAMAQALKEADTGVVMPFDFLRLVWVSVLGYVLFSEVPGLFTWVGGGVIFASAAYLAYRENAQRREEAVTKIAPPGPHA